MRSHQLLALIGFVLLILVGSYAWKIFVEPAETAVLPQTASISLDYTEPGSRINSSERVTFWQKRVQNAPSDYISMTYLGQAYWQLARETADVSNYNKAEQALEAALEQNPNYLSASAFLAAVRFAQHDFSSALELAQQVYAEDDGALLALALIGDAQLELGRYEEASATYEELATLNDSPPVLSRLARLAWLNGDVRSAVTHLTNAAEMAQELDLRGENLAWYQFQLGELYFHQGDLEAANEQYLAALNSYPNYYLAMAGQAKVEAAHGNIDTAISLYNMVVDRVPQPGFIASLGNLYIANEEFGMAEKQFELVDAISDLETSQGILYNQQIAKFYADHGRSLDQSLLLAKRELTIRQDVYTYDVLAWALYQNGRYAEAKEAIDQALHLNTPDATFYFHAGMIYDALGETAVAKQMFTKALAINPYFDVNQAPIAQQKVLAYQSDDAEGS